MAEAAAQQNYPANTWKVTGHSTKAQVYPAVDAPVAFTADVTTVTVPAGVFLSTLGEETDGLFIDLTQDNWLVVVPKTGAAAVVAEVNQGELGSLFVGDYATVHRILRVQAIDYQQF